MTLPRALALQDSGLSYRVVDWDVWTLTSPPAAVGVATISTDPVEQGFLLLVERLVIGTTSTARTACNVYAAPPGNLSPAYRRDGTPAGNDAVAEYPRPFLVPAGVPLTLVWTGADAGAQAFVSVQYQLVQTVS